MADLRLGKETVVRIGRSNDPRELRRVISDAQRLSQERRALANQLRGDPDEQVRFRRAMQQSQLYDRYAKQAQTRLNTVNAARRGGVDINEIVSARSRSAARSRADVAGPVQRPVTVTSSVSTPVTAGPGGPSSRLTPQTELAPGITLARSELTGRSILIQEGGTGINARFIGTNPAPTPSASQTFVYDTTVSPERKFQYETDQAPTLMSGVAVSPGPAGGVFRAVKGVNTRAAKTFDELGVGPGSKTVTGRFWERGTETTGTRRTFFDAVAPSFAETGRNNPIRVSVTEGIADVSFRNPIVPAANIIGGGVAGSVLKTTAAYSTLNTGALATYSAVKGSFIGAGVAGLGLVGLSAYQSPDPVRVVSGAVTSAATFGTSYFAATGRPGTLLQPGRRPFAPRVQGRAPQGRGVVEIVGDSSDGRIGGYDVPAGQPIKPGGTLPSRVFSQTKTPLGEVTVSVSGRSNVRDFFGLDKRGSFRGGRVVLEPPKVEYTNVPRSSGPIRRGSSSGRSLINRDTSLEIPPATRIGALPGVGAAFGSAAATLPGFKTSPGIRVSPRLGSSQPQGFDVAPITRTSSGVASRIIPGITTGLVIGGATGLFIGRPGGPLGGGISITPPKIVPGTPPPVFHGFGGGFGGFGRVRRRPESPRYNPSLGVVLGVVKGSKRARKSPFLTGFEFRG